VTVGRLLGLVFINRLGSNYFALRCSPCPSAISCAAILGLIVGVTSNVGGYLMPIAAAILARAIRDPKDLAHARLPSSVAPAAPFICGSCPSHPVTVLGEYRTDGLLLPSLRKNAAFRIFPDQVPIDPLRSTYYQAPNCYPLLTG
jgi:hypothetical protein